MRAYKLDQNIPARVATQLRNSGFDVATVSEQDMEGAADPVVHAVCRYENRVLVTFDLDFADIRAYPPSKSRGLIVLRPPTQSAAAVSSLVHNLIPLLQRRDPDGELWIVEDDRVRIRSGEE